MPGSDGLAFLKKDYPRARKIINRDFSKLEGVDKLVSAAISVRNAKKYVLQKILK